MIDVKAIPAVKASPWNDPNVRPYVRLERLTKSFGDFNPRRSLEA